MTDIVEKFRKTQLEEEEKIAKKLRPACPTQMKKDRSAIVRALIRADSGRTGGRED